MLGKIETRDVGRISGWSAEAQQIVERRILGPRGRLARIPDCGVDISGDGGLALSGGVSRPYPSGTTKPIQ